MCGSMTDIQSAAAEIRQGKKDRKIERTNDRMKIYMVCPITYGDHKLEAILGNLLNFGVHGTAVSIFSPIE